MLVEMLTTLAIVSTTCGEVSQMQRHCIAKVYVWLAAFQIMQNTIIYIAFPTYVKNC